MEELNQMTEIEATEASQVDQVLEMRKNMEATNLELSKTKAELSKAMNALVNGSQIDIKEAEPVDKDKLRKELYCLEPNLSNLEYWDKTLQLRQAIIDEGGSDPFLPAGQKIAASAEDREKANNVAKIVQECIDYAQGDSSIFTTELNRRTVDTSPMMGRRRR